MDAVNQGAAISLTYYELGNSVWKLHYLQKKLSEAESRLLLAGSLELFARLTLLVLDKGDALEIEKLASKRNLTFYDSAYLYTAKRESLPLITDDERLSKVAHTEKVETVSSVSILSRLEE